MKASDIGPLMVDIEGLEISAEEAELLSMECVGGIILFTRNFVSTSQLSALITSLREVKPQLLIAVDHEGGRVQRFRNGFTQIPPMAKLGKLFEKSKSHGLELSHEIGWLFASELRSFDIDFSFAPVLDRNHQKSQVIGDRAFSEDIGAIEHLGAALMSGMNEAGMAATGKHFPGHGAVAADSHTDIPVDTRSFAAIRNEDMCVFETLVQKGIQALMPAHVIYEQVDRQPAGFSEVWMQQILRRDLGFEGVIFSDDLGMEGATVAGNFEQRAEAALSAGCDMVLVCNEPEGARAVAQYLEGSLRPANSRLNSMRGGDDRPSSLDALQRESRWQKITLALADMV